jgi:hypothetical protein
MKFKSAFVYTWLIAAFIAVCTMIVLIIESADRERKSKYNGVSEIFIVKQANSNGSEEDQYVIRYIQGSDTGTYEEARCLASGDYIAFKYSSSYLDSARATVELLKSNLKLINTHFNPCADSVVESIKLR